mmetsp:Transcript_24024/g.56795  ORF Transcript_24024/g.56795 Transcript_24024/m.56795 type:complete len:226 (+) Transcript_24024:415-1092(+)
MNSTSWPSSDSLKVIRFSFFVSTLLSAVVFFTIDFNGVATTADGRLGPALDAAGDVVGAASSQLPMSETTADEVVEMTDNFETSAVALALLELTALVALVVLLPLFLLFGFSTLSVAASLSPSSTRLKAAAWMVFEATRFFFFLLPIGVLPGDSGGSDFFVFFEDFFFRELLLLARTLVSAAKGTETCVRTPTLPFLFSGGLLVLLAWSGNVNLDQLSGCCCCCC